MVQAFRLPTGAFHGTKIGTDILLLRKKEQARNVDVSDYFLQHPNHVLGEIRERTNRFGKLEKFVHGHLEEALLKIEHLQNKKEVWRMGNLFEDQFLELTSQTNPHPKTKTKEQEFLETDEQKITEALEILQNIKFKSPVVHKEIDKLQKFQQKIESNSYEEDDFKAVLESADKILQRKNKFKSSGYQRQNTPNLKKGVLKYQFVKKDEIAASALQNNPNISQEQIDAFQETAYDGTLNNYGKHYKFANYYEGKWVHDFYYVEGNIYAKLKQLEIDFIDKNAVGGTENQYEKQKALLESVLPKSKSLEDIIIISPNHEFVHKFYLGKVEKEVYNYDTREHEKVLSDYTLADKFKDFIRDLSSDAFAGSSAWEVYDFVDNQTVTGSDRERNALIRERRKEVANDLFQKFIREEISEDLRNRFVQDFNRGYNNIHVPDYAEFPLFSHIHLNFKGKPLKLTEVQKAGVGRLTTKGVGLLAHEVGFGKTLSGILSMHEAMERGNAKRPLIVVPNDAILKQWVETIYETIPNAKVNVLGNLGKSYDLSDFDNYDGEISIVTYSGFNNIGFSESITKALADKFSYITDSELKSVKNTTEREDQIEIQKEKELQGKMKRGKIYDWEDFGFDHLTFDEVHNANHIVGEVRIEDRRFASDFRSQSQRTSALGINTWMAAQYIQENNDGRNVTLLSATPFTNKPLEYYSILSLVANKRLEEQGFFNVNNFFETFMEADNEMEIDAKGEVKYKTNVRRFKNNALFQQLLSEFIDIKGEEDNPELIRPNRINKEYKIEPNDLTQEQYDLLNNNFVDNENGAILTHILNARLIAISPYLSPYYDDKQPTIKEFVENSGKLKTAMDLIAQNKWDKPEAGQIIYSELAVNEFPKLKNYLLNEIGFEDRQVAIITGATSKTKRIKIQNDFNEGKIKIILGSEAIQEGMNLQQNTSDMYLLSLPYNFTSLRQTEGRAWRQGNQWESVRINYMLTEDSIDVFMLQKLQAKQARYLEAMKKDVNILDISDINTHELKTSLITNPETRAEVEIKIEQKRLESEKSRLIADTAFVLRKQQDVIHVQQKLSDTKSEVERYKMYAQEEGANSDYWTGEITRTQKKIIMIEEEFEEVIDKLAKKGIDVKAIESNIKRTENKVKAIEEKIENLPVLQNDLTEKYKKEKEEKSQSKNQTDWVKERAEENKTFF